MSSQEPKRRFNKWLVLVNIPIQMGIIIYLSAWLGGWLDEKYPDHNRIWIKVLTLLGVAIAMYNLNRQVQDINRKKDE